MKIIFAGTPEIAETVLKKLLTTEHDIIAVYTQPDRPAGRGRQLTASPVKQLALVNTIPVEQPETLKTPEAQAQLASYQADLMIVVAYGLILPQAILDMPQHGCWNVHVSLLPRWRGAAPIQRAIEAGDKQTGVSIMQMDAGLDTGDILLQRQCGIACDETTGSLHDKLATQGADALLTALQQYDAGTLHPTAQTGDVCYAKKLSKQEALIDWSKPATTIERKIRAFNPWPGCYFEHKGQRIKVWQVSAQPGTEGISMQTGNGVLRLLELQLPGTTRQSAKAILNGHPDLFD